MERHSWGYVTVVVLYGMGFIVSEEIEDFGVVLTGMLLEMHQTPVISHGLFVMLEVKYWP